MPETIGNLNSLVSLNLSQNRVTFNNIRGILNINQNPLLHRTIILHNDQFSDDNITELETIFRTVDLVDRVVFPPGA